MNDNQIAAEAWKHIRNLPEALEFYDDVEGPEIIKAACEKARFEGYKRGRHEAETCLRAAQEGRSGWIHAGWLEKEPCQTCKDMIFVTESRAAQGEDVRTHCAARNKTY